VRDSHPLPGTDVVLDGIRLHVVSHGGSAAGVSHGGSAAGDPADAGRLPLLLLHGLPTTSYLWRDVMRDLEHQLRCWAPDLAGLGRSERPARRCYDPISQSRLMLALLDRLGLDRVILVGHDLGGSVAVALAALAPERVAGLVLIGAPVHTEVWPVPAVLPLLLPGMGRPYAGVLRRVPRLARAVLAGALGAGTPDSGLEARELDYYLAPLLRADGARSLVQLVRAVDMEPVEAAWRLLRAAPPPTLVLWGERDRVHAVSYGRRVAAELPGASWVPVADAGHLLPQERPERVAEELAGFAAELAPSVAKVVDSGQGS
jgi:2-hydroxymuconate-semialdehyde hydrolase